MIEDIEKALGEYGIEDKQLAFSIFMTLFVIVGREDRLTAEQRKLMLGLISQIEQTEIEIEKMSEVSRFRYLGLVDDAVHHLERLRAGLRKELEDQPAEVKRPTTAHGQETMEIYEHLKAAGVNDEWLCVKIIADILVATGKSDKPVDNLRRSVWDRIRRTF